MEMCSVGFSLNGSRGIVNVALIGMRNEPLSVLFSPSYTICCIFLLLKLLCLYLEISFSIIGVVLSFHTKSCTQYIVV